MEQVKIFLCGDVMLGRGIDQILPHPSSSEIPENYISNAVDYVVLAEQVNGPIHRPVDFEYVWGDALAELDRAHLNLRLINLETSARSY